MTEFELTLDKEKNRLYLKEEIAKILVEESKKRKGTETVKGLANAETVLLYPDDANYERILESIKILEADVVLRIKRQKEKNE